MAVVKEYVMQKSAIIFVSIS